MISCCGSRYRVLAAVCIWHSGCENGVPVKAVRWHTVPQKERMIFDRRKQW